MTVPVPTTPPPRSSWRKAVNVGTVVVSTVLGALVGYLANVWIMAVRSDGYNVKAGSAAAAPGNLLQGSLFWLLAPTVVFAVFGYWRAIGTKRFAFEMRRLPRMLLMLGKTSGSGFQTQFLVGALVGVLASLWIGPTLGLVASLGFVTMLPTAASSVLSSFGYKLTSFLSSKMAKPPAALAPDGAGLMTTVIAMFGSAAALLVGFFVTSSTAKWVIAAALVVLIVVRSGRLRRNPAALVLVVVALAGLGVLLSAHGAHADDGGWIECTGQSWWSCPGSSTVRSWGALGAALGAVGGALGGALGGFFGSWPAGSILDDPDVLSPGDPGNDLDPEAADGWIRGVLDSPEYGDWAGTHSPSDPLSPEDFDDYMGWRHDQGLDDPPLPEPADWGEDESSPFAPEPEGPTGEEPGGVTTAEVVEGPTDKFEGSEGWSGEPGGEGDLEADFDDLLDDLGDLLGPEEEGPGGEDFLGDEEGGPDSELGGGLGEDTGEPEGEEGEYEPEGEGEEGEYEPEGEGEGEEGEYEPEGEGEGEEGEYEPEGEGEGEEGEYEPEGEEPESEEGEDYDTSRYRPGPETGAVAGTEAGRTGAEVAEGEVGEGEGPGQKPSLEGDPRFDDSMHEIDPEGRVVDADGRPLTDPLTGEPLKVDADGNVKYGDEWVDPKTAANRAALDATHVAEVAHGEKLVEDFRDLRSQLEAATDPAQRAEIEAAIRDKAAEINGDYQAKIALKNEGRTETVADFDKAIHEVYGNVDSRNVDAMSERGIKIGGREFTKDDMKEFRNAKSAGTSSLDRDYGLNEAKVQDIEGRLARARPGSEEAQKLSRELIEARRAQQITVDYDKLLDSTRQQLDAAEPGSARAEELAKRLTRYEADAARNKQTYMNDLQQRLDRAPEGSPRAEALRAELDAAAGRAAGRADTPVSKNTWNEYGTDSYRDSYTEVTGRDPKAAFQSVTTARGTAESYADASVLANNPAERPFDPRWAEQTASVTGHKVNDMNHLAREGDISKATAVQEAARGTAKDTSGKLINQLELDPRADPAKVQTVRDINDVLTRAGRGEIPPGRVDTELRKVVPGDPNMNVDKAVRIIEGNLEAATKFQTRAGEVDTTTPRVGEVEGPPRPGDTGGPGRLDRGFAAASDLAAFDANRQALIDKGMDPVEATAVAAVQTHAGNVAQASGIADPRTSMVGGALLPRGVDNLLPDRALENTIGTGYEANKALVQSLNDSIRTGRLDTTALDRFNTDLVNRPGADPFRGLAEIGRFAGESWSRDDGGNVVSDMRQIIETGAGAEVLDQNITEFQAEVAAGKHGPALQGLDHVIRIASELGVDPQGTVGEFVEDLRTIYNNGVGEGYWTDAANHAVDVLHNTPVVGHVVKGYEEIGGVVGDVYEGVKQQGVVGYGKEVVGEVGEVAGYVYDETTTSISNGASYVANSASNFGAWVKTFF